MIRSSLSPDTSLEVPGWAGWIRTRLLQQLLLQFGKPSRVLLEADA
jgi:hypothetical protein